VVAFLAAQQLSKPRRDPDDMLPVALLKKIDLAAYKIDFIPA
jgi:hypothetical protein